MNARLSLALLVVLLAMPLAGAQVVFRPTGDLFLTADNALATAPGEPADAPCLAVNGPNAQAQTAEFTTSLAEGEYTVAAANLTLVVALDGAGGASQSGTSGFSLAAEVAFGNATPIAAQQDFGPAQSPASATLLFPLPRDVTAAGALLLRLTLAPGGGALPVGAALDVRVVCNNVGTKIASFDLQGEIAIPGAEEPPPGIALPGPAILGVAVLAGLATLAAGLLALAGRTISERRVHLLLGVTAGLLLAIALIDLVPEAIELEENAVFTIAFGILGLFVIKWVSGSHSHSHGGGRSHEGHAHDHPHVHPTSGVARLALLAFFALGFHRLIDGVVLPAAFEVGGATGLAAAGAILAHQFPDGIAGASVFLAAGWSRRKVALGVGVLALLTPVGTLVGLTFLGLSGFIGHLIALAAATFIFIALSELLPELGAPQFRRVVIVGVVIGYAAALGLETLASMFGGR